jgi:hypothetical protein
MEWKEPRDVLNHAKINYIDIGTKLNMTSQNRIKILKNNGYTCRTCGGVYRTYLMMDLIKEQKCHDTYCSACYVITHLNNNVHEYIDLYYSTMSQLDIIRNTINNVIANGKIPLPYEIDPEIKSVSLSTLEYINFFNHVNEFDNYKFFFNEKFNTYFVTNNYNNLSFVDETELVPENDINCPEIKEHKMTDKEQMHNDLLPNDSKFISD